MPINKINWTTENGTVADVSDVKRITNTLDADSGIIETLNAIADNDTGKIKDSAVPDGFIKTVMIDTINPPSDSHVLSYNATANRFEWVNPSETGDSYKIKVTALDDPGYISSKLNSEHFTSDGNQISLINELSLPSLTMGSKVTKFSVDGTFGDNSDTNVPSEKAIKTYFDTNSASKTSKVPQNFQGDLQVKGNVVFHQGNDGTGSGLDADTVDGIESTRFFYGTNSYGSANVSDANAIAKSGFYDLDAASANLPTAADGGILHVQWRSGTEYACQIYNAYNGSGMWMRTQSASIWGAWQKVWHAGNDGAGSGLDADTVDGYHVNTSSFMPTAGLLKVGDYGIGSSAPTVISFNQLYATGFYYGAGTADGAPNSLSEWHVIHHRYGNNCAQIAISPTGYGTYYRVNNNGSWLAWRNISDTVMGTALASAETTEIATTANGNIIHITGTTTITSFGRGITGQRRTLVFDNSLIVKHTASVLICPGGLSINTTAGTVLDVICENGTNGYWRVTNMINPIISFAEMSYLDGVTSNIQTQINAKAPIASPVFTGTPATTTPPAGDSTTRIASTAWVSTLVGGTTSAICLVVGTGVVYIFPSGMMIQIGTVTVNTGEAGTIVLPVAFPNNFLAVAESESGGNNYTVKLTRSGLGQVGWRQDLHYSSGSSLVATIDYIAIGN